ncbi:hypothetical protein E2C01_065752 [Portunus trituberculatus]|uniref:Uncharacterized protein n=1 Tax=Portunus trituberculatus TaxID=210409 RepID=A0A5B7HSN2_PORTR|nr:hypothetical protein [Portunus trituberculatus]
MQSNQRVRIFKARQEEKREVDDLMSTCENTPKSRYHGPSSASFTHPLYPTPAPPQHPIDTFPAK